MKQADIDDGQRPGTTSADADRIAGLERENRELRRSNEILKAASAFFASQCHDDGCLVGLAGFFAAPALWLVACPEVRPHRALSRRGVA